MSSMATAALMSHLPVLLFAALSVLLLFLIIQYADRTSLRSDPVIGNAVPYTPWDLSLPRRHSLSKSKEPYSGLTKRAS
jgi:hypothetical protein